MAEKDFKLSSSLELKSSEGIRFGTESDWANVYLRFDAMAQKLQANSWNLALESYVDDAIANSTVNVDALAGFGLYNNSGTLVVNTDAIATHDFVSQEIANLVNSAPSTLDTLNELSAALGDDANFATSISNLIGEKTSNTDVVTIVSGLLEGGLTWNGTGINVTTDNYTLFLDGNNSAAVTVNTDVIATREYVDSQSVDVNALAGSGLVANGSALDIKTGQVGLGYWPVVVESNSGNLAVAPYLNQIAGPGLYYNMMGDNLAVNVDALAGEFIKSDGPTLSVDKYALSTGLASTGLMVDTLNDGLMINVTALAGQGLTYDSSGDFILAVDPFGAHIQYDGDDYANTTYASVNTAVARSYVGGGEYTTLYTVPSTAHSFEALVTFFSESTGKSRTSKIIASTNAAGSVEYTEFGIVENGGAIQNVDVLVETDTTTNNYAIKVQGNNSKATAEIKWVTVA